MPDEKPIAPNPASGAERPSLTVEPMRGGTTSSFGTTCVVPCACFADDDSAAPSAGGVLASPFSMSFADDSE